MMEILESPALPPVDAASDQPLLAHSDNAPKFGGGHGQWGFYFLKEASGRHQKNFISVFFNGDNRNSSLDPCIIGAMIANKWPIVKITTTRTTIDRKGGIEGADVVETTRGVMLVPAQMEIAKAAAAAKALNNDEDKIFEIA